MIKSLPTVYLCGPIAGQTFDEANGWRKYVEERLGSEIHCRNPLRAKERLRKHGKLGHTGYDQIMSTERAIITRDRRDTTMSDLVLSNLLPAEATGKVSIGSVIEFGWADAASHFGAGIIPIVAVMPRIEAPNGLITYGVHDHVMMRALADWTVPDLDTAIEVIKAVLL